MQLIPPLLAGVFVLFCLVQGEQPNPNPNPNREGKGNVYFSGAPPLKEDPGVTVEKQFLSTSRQNEIKAFVSKVSNPVGYFHTLPSSPEGCTGRTKTSKIAESYGCYFAVNGGTFDMNTGECEGSVIGNGTIYQLADDDLGFASFGLTADNRWVFGAVTSDIVKSEGVSELLSGFIGPLLVQEGVAVHSDNTLVAQRTAVGIDEKGQLIILTIDGAEEPPRGMNISELGDAMVDLGVVTAINLDGGGSTTAWMDGDYVDRPTCNDHLIPGCERTVASIVCIMPGNVSSP